MMFNPEKMCWISTLPAGEDEPDPFEGMADDEDESLESLELTRRKSLGSSLGRTRSNASEEMDDDFATLEARPNSSGQFVRGKIDLKLGRGLFGNGMVGRQQHQQVDRNMSINSSIYSYPGSEAQIPSHRYSSIQQPYAANNGYDARWDWIDRELYEETVEADKRHREEMKGWYGSLGAAGSGSGMDKARKEKGEEREKRREEKRLWEIRHLVMDG